MNRIEALKDCFDNLTTAEKVRVWNEYAYEHATDNIIYPMEEFDDIMGDAARSEGPWWIACRIFYGDFKPCHNYFWANGYNNLCSSDFENDMPMSIDESFLEWYATSENIEEDDIRDEFMECLFESLEDINEDVVDEVLTMNDIRSTNWDEIINEIRNYIPDTEDE